MSRSLYLRTCRPDGGAFDGFRWPLVVGATVTPVHWSPVDECGNGLHGLRGGCGDGTLLDWSPEAVWLVFSADDSDAVDLTTKWKVREARVEHVGDRLAATAYLADNGCAGAIVGATATAGYGGTATAGYGGTATAGYGGTATAGYGGTATAGERGTATAGERGTATAGERGTATAGYGGTATAGYRGTATAGYGGTATAGDGGLIEIAWWDEAADRHRRAIAYIGENGIKANKPYRLNAAHEFEEVKP